MQTSLCVTNPPVVEPACFHFGTALDNAQARAFDAAAYTPAVGTSDHDSLGDECNPDGKPDRCISRHRRLISLTRLECSRVAALLRMSA